VPGSTVYNIWKNRNELKHGTQPRVEEQILQRIKWEVRAQIVGRGNFVELWEMREYAVNEELIKGILV
jgi:DNA-binding transcriptional regulator/RsmH inhibitor MraZ